MASILARGPASGLPALWHTVEGARKGLAYALPRRGEIAWWPHPAPPVGRMSKARKEAPSEFTMGLVLVETREERRLVAAWPTLAEEVRSECFAGTAAGFALWFRNAGVADLPVHHLSAESLIRSGICRLNGSVQEDVAASLSGRPSGPKRR